MPMWRCPHCSTPQPEAARCWLCRRSTTTCAACRHYRRGVAGGLGVCGKSPGRLALRGGEVRPCWEPIPAPPPPPGGAGEVRPPGREESSARTFVPVDALGARAGQPIAAEPMPSRAAPDDVRWSLWGDGEA